MMDMSKAEEAQEVVKTGVTTQDVTTGTVTPEKYDIDTVHNDEAVKVLASYHGNQTWTPQEEKKVRTKIDRKLLPILCFTYGLQYYDKTMISQAVSSVQITYQVGETRGLMLHSTQALFGLRTDLDLSGNRYSMSSAIFFLGFIVGAYPASQLAQRFPIEKVAGGLVLLWGITFILTAACFTWQALYVERFFLGFFEAGVSPIFMLMVGQFYKKDEQSFMMG